MCVWIHVYRIEVSHGPSHPEFWVNLSLEWTDWPGWLTTMSLLLSQYNDYRFAESPDVAEQRLGSRNRWELTSWSTSMKQRERVTEDAMDLLKLQSLPLLTDTPPSTRPHLLILCKQFHQMFPAMYSLCEPMRVILIQITTFHSLASTDMQPYHNAKFI